MANFDELLSFVADEKQMSEMASRTFEEIILNRKYHYESFVEEVDLAIDRLFARKGRLESRFSASRGSVRRI